MKTYFSTTMYLLLLFSFSSSLSQTSITNKDYEVTDDVVKIEKVKYKQISLSGLDKPQIHETSECLFKNGLIKSSKYKYGQSNKVQFSIYKHTRRLKEFLKEYYMLDNGVRTNESETIYKAQKFKNLTFYFPATNFSISENTPNKLTVQYKTANANPYHTFELKENNTIQEFIHTGYGPVINTYNLQGVKIKEFFPGISGNNIEYGKDGLIIKKKKFGSAWSNNTTFIHYANDAKGNWIEKIEIEKDLKLGVDKITFSARKLTYSNGEVVGSTDFDESNIIMESTLLNQDLEYSVSSKTGCISGDCQNGFGKRAYGEKDLYEGNFKDGFRHGKGTYKFANGASYIGEYFNGVMYGKGILKFPNGDLYEGEFKGDQRDGIGTYNFENGNKYEGNWKKGLQHGKGIMYDYIANIKQEAIYNEGKIVEVLSRTTISESNNKNVSSTSKKTGCISGDCKNGFGTFVGIEGEDTIKIIGNFKNSVLSGYGKSYLNNQLTYDGQWEDFKYHGKGTLYTGDSNEHKFIGEFKNGIKEGPCKMYTNEKLVFEGNYVNNAIEGEGTYYNYKTGKKNVSIYKNGNPIKVISSDPIIVNNHKATSNSVNTTNKITWKKNETNSYWLYNNGVLKSGGKSFWQGNNLYVYMVDEATLYLLKNYKTETPNTTHQAVLLPNTFPNGLWYKTTSGGVIVCNAKGLFVKTTEIYKYDTNGIDVLFKGKDEKETLFLKNFKNVSANVVFPAEVYNASKISNSSSGNLKDKSNIDSYILNCKSEDNEATCLAQKLEEDVNKLQSQGKSQTEINSFLENKMKILANYNVDTLYNIILAFKYNSKTAKLMMPLVKKLPQHQQNRIKELANKTMSNYSKKQQEYQNKQRKN